MRLLARTLALVSALTLTALAADPTSFQVGSFTFKRSSTFQWQSVDPSGMRKAHLTVGDAKDITKRGDVTFFHFGPGAGGGVDANIQRWVGQFTPEKPDVKPVTERAEVKGVKLTRVRMEGTFASGMPGGPTTPLKDFALLGVIIESPNGDVFIKFTGPSEIVKTASGAFEELVKSALD